MNHSPNFYTVTGKVNYVNKYDPGFRSKRYAMSAQGHSGNLYNKDKRYNSPIDTASHLNCKNSEDLRCSQNMNTMKLPVCSKKPLVKRKRPNGAICRTPQGHDAEFQDNDEFDLIFGTSDNGPLSDIRCPGNNIKEDSNDHTEKTKQRKEKHAINNSIERSDRLKYINGEQLYQNENNNYPSKSSCDKQGTKSYSVNGKSKGTGIDYDSRKLPDSIENKLIGPKRSNLELNMVEYTEKIRRAKNDVNDLYNLYHKEASVLHVNDTIRPQILDCTLSNENFENKLALGKRSEFNDFTFLRTRNTVKSMHNNSSKESAESQNFNKLFKTKLIAHTQQNVSGECQEAKLIKRSNKILKQDIQKRCEAVQENRNVSREKDTAFERTHLNSEPVSAPNLLFHNDTMSVVNTNEVRENNTAKQFSEVKMLSSDRTYPTSGTSSAKAQNSQTAVTTKSDEAVSIPLHVFHHGRSVRHKSSSQQLENKLSEDLEELLNEPKQRFRLLAPLPSDTFLSIAESLLDTMHSEHNIIMKLLLAWQSQTRQIEIELKNHSDQDGSKQPKQQMLIQLKNLRKMMLNRLDYLRGVEAEARLNKQVNYPKIKGDPQEQIAAFKSQPRISRGDQLPSIGETYKSTLLNVHPTDKEDLVSENKAIEILRNESISSPKIVDSKSFTLIPVSKAEKCVASADSSTNLAHLVDQTPESAHFKVNSNHQLKTVRSEMDILEKEQLNISNDHKTIQSSISANLDLVWRSESGEFKEIAISNEEESTANGNNEEVAAQVNMEVPLLPVQEQNVDNEAHFHPIVGSQTQQHILREVPEDIPDMRPQLIGNGRNRSAKRAPSFFSRALNKFSNRRYKKK